MASFRTEGRKGYVHLPPGKYFWKVVDAERVFKNGVEQIKLSLDVGSNEAGVERITEILTFSEKAFFRIEHFMKSAGIYPGDGVDVELRDGDCINLKGSCSTSEREYNGRMYSNIDQWLEASRQRTDYLVPATPPPSTTPEPSSYTRADDIPF